MKLKGTHHVALPTPNFDELRKFYGQTLGFEEVREWPEVPIVFFNVGSTTIELIGRDSASANVSSPGSWDHLALHVESVDEAYAELVEKGVKIREEPRNFQNVRIAFFFDPDGNVLELVEDPRVEQ